MAQWSRDHVPFPGATFRQLVDELVRKNVLMTGSIRLGDRKIDLVWQHTSGTVAAWLMNGTRAVAMRALTPNTVTSSWRLAAPR